MLNKSDFTIIPFHQKENSLEKLLIKIKQKINKLINSVNFGIYLNYKNLSNEDGEIKISINSIRIEKIPISYIYKIEMEIKEDKLVLKKTYSELLNYFLIIKENFPFIILPSFANKISLNDYSMNFLKLKFEPIIEKIESQKMQLILYFRRFFSNSIVASCFLDFVQLLAFITQENTIDCLDNFKNSTKKFLSEKNSKKKLVNLSTIFYFDANFAKIRNVKKIIKNLLNRILNDLKLEQKIKTVNRKIAGLIDKQDNKDAYNLIEIKKLESLINILSCDLNLMEKTIKKFLIFVEMNFLKSSKNQIKINDIFESISKNNDLPSSIVQQIKLLRDQMGILLENYEEDLKIILHDYNQIFSSKVFL